MSNQRGGTIVKQVYTIPEVAKLVRFSEQTIREWVRDGRVKAVRPGLRAWRIPRAEGQRLLAELNIDDSVLDDSDGGKPYLDKGNRLGVKSTDIVTPMQAAT